MKKYFAILLILISVKALPQDGITNCCQSFYNHLQAKKFDRAKECIDLCMQIPQVRVDAKLWLYRGLIYQTIYDDTSALDYGIGKDSALLVGIQSYLVSYCLNKYDTISADRMIYDSLYRLEHLSTFESSQCLNEAVAVRLYDSIFPRVFDLIEQASLLSNKEKECYNELFEMMRVNLDAIQLERIQSDEIHFEVTIHGWRKNLGGTGNFDYLVIEKWKSRNHDESNHEIVSFTVQGFSNDSLLFSVAEIGHYFTEISLNPIMQLHKGNIVRICQITILFNNSYYYGDEIVRKLF